MSIDKIPTNTVLNFTETSQTQQRRGETVQSEATPSETEESSRTFKEDDISDAITGLNNLLKSTQTHVKFELHEKSKEYYVSVVDSRTNEIIREIPSKKLLDIYASMTEFLGLIFDKKI
ncbi:flagellar protein FlaG [Litchfieldia salsa]|uniref:Flagellar protein FlaG n=1 Tax=Litchfieldia salsa TaxID=930152 RepID=A0A1H0WDR2_9BACI|nr:flagellar protein FlaG [Litchfieldia salsa]SDP88723.1 flagellar protein FlaG [Litchfieldia salsa]